MAVARALPQCLSILLIIPSFILPLFPKEIRPKADVIAGSGGYLDGRYIRYAQRITLTAMLRVQTLPLKQQA